MLAGGLLTFTGDIAGWRMYTVLCLTVERSDCWLTKKWVVCWTVITPRPRVSWYIHTDEARTLQTWDCPHTCKALCLSCFTLKCHFISSWAGHFWQSRRVRPPSLSVWGGAGLCGGNFVTTRTFTFTQPAVLASTWSYLVGNFLGTRIFLELIEEEYWECRHIPHVVCEDC